MPNIIEITDFSTPELDVYARLTQAQLRNRLEPEKGVFIAESPKVIARALDAGYQPLSLLMERKQITGPAQDILTRCGDAPVYTGRPRDAGPPDRLRTDPRRAVRLPPPRAQHSRAGMPGCPPGGCAGGHRGFHQRGCHLPQCCRIEHGCGAHHASPDLRLAARRCA